MRSNAGIESLRTATGSRAYAYVELSTLAGDWINMGAVEIGSASRDFLNGATLRDSIDSNTWAFSAQFAREVGVGSLSPFRTDSVVNVVGGAFQPLADLHRQWRIWIAAPTPLTFRELARGWTDRIDIAGDSPVITVQGRGQEADLIDRRIMFVDPTADPLVLITDATPKVYAGGAIADVLQAILDDFMGAGVVPLTVDASAPSFYVDGWNQTTDVGLFDLLTQVAGLAGAVVRYRYDASDVLSLTLFTPNRTPTTPDWTTNARAYERLNAGIDKQPIRNFVVVSYTDANFGAQTVTSPVVATWPPTSASISRYGLRVLPISLAASTQVNDQTRAGALADAIRSDTEFPAIEQDLTEVNAWFGELWDYVRTDANGVHYNEDQFGGVTAVEHVFANGMLRSSFGLRGKPAGRYRGWLDFGTGAPRTPFTPEITNLTAAWKEVLDPLGGGTLIPGVFSVAMVNQYARSVTFALSATLDFAVVISAASVDVTNGTAEYGWVGSGFVSPGTVYYVRATPYSGVLSGGTPTGVAGKPVIASTYTNKLTPSQPQFDDLVGTIGDLAGTVGAIGIPTVFVNVVEDDQWLALSTIPAAEVEVGAEFRRQRYLVGAGSVRLNANIKTLTGTPTVKLKYSVNGFGAVADLVTWTPPGTGLRTSAWAALPAGAKADAGLTVYVANGADTAALDLYELDAEFLPTIVAGGRVHVAAFAAAFN